MPMQELEMFKDPILKKLSEKYPSPEIKDQSEFLFRQLVRAIIVQQLSVKVADIIYKRFINLFSPKDFPTPDDVLIIDKEIIRAVGISYSKISYIKGIAEAFVNGQISVDKLQQMTDDEVMLELTKIKGVGPWTAEMILIFTLNR